MLVAWRLYLVTGFTTDNAKKIEATNGGIARYMMNWISGRDRGPWVKMKVKDMTKRRDEVRQKLRERVGLVQSQLRVYWCSKPKCVLEGQAKKPSSPLTVMIRREYQAPW